MLIKIFLDPIKLTFLLKAIANEYFESIFPSSILKLKFKENELHVEKNIGKISPINQLEKISILKQLKTLNRLQNYKMRIFGRFTNGWNFNYFY